MLAAVKPDAVTRDARKVHRVIADVVFKTADEAGVGLQHTARRRIRKIADRRNRSFLSHINKKLAARIVQKAEACRIRIRHAEAILTAAEGLDLEIRIVDRGFFEARHGASVKFSSRPDRRGNRDLADAAVKLQVKISRGGRSDGHIKIVHVLADLATGNHLAAIRDHLGKDGLVRIVDDEEGLLVYQKFIGIRKRQRGGGIFSVAGIKELDVSVLAGIGSRVDKRVDHIFLRPSFGVNEGAVGHADLPPARAVMVA